ncbi:MAG: phosphotransacetylase family protein [Desulfovibrio sp.]
MSSLYIGSTSGYSGKNMIVMGIGLQLQKEGYNIGYMKPVGAMPLEQNGVLGDEDAFFVQSVLELDQDPAVVSPVVVTHDFKVAALNPNNKKLGDLIGQIKEKYSTLSDGKDAMLVAGSGSMYSGKYCGTDGISVVQNLDTKCIVIDRFVKETNYDALLVLKETLGDQLLGIVINDVPAHSMEEVTQLIAPFLESRGVKVLGVIPKDPLMGAIKVGDLADRLGGKVISAHGRSDRIVENFLIGTMQVENFMTHFRKNKNSAVIVGGDRSDVQLVALEGDCPCLVLTGNLYPNDIILTRSEVLDTPIIIVRDDTFTVAKKMENILSRHKLRDNIKIRQGAELVAQNVDLDFIKKGIGLK